MKAFTVSASDDTVSRSADISTQDGVEDESDNLTYVDVDEIITDGDDENEISLPQHQRQAAHTLNLLATNEIEAANSDAQYKKVS